MKSRRSGTAILAAKADESLPHRQTSLAFGELRLGKRVTLHAKSVASSLARDRARAMADSQVH